MPPPSNHYTPSVNRDRLDFGYAIAFHLYQNFINDLTQRAISHPVNIPQIDVENFMEAHRAGLDRIAHVLIEMFELPVDGFRPRNTGLVHSGSTQQQVGDTQSGMIEHPNGQTNGHANGHADGHPNGQADAASDNEGIDSDSNELLIPNGLLPTSTTYNSTAVLPQVVTRYHANADAYGAQAPPAQNHGETPTGHGTSTALGAYNPRPARRHTMP